MAGNRWQNLDFDRPRRSESAPDPVSPPPTEAGSHERGTATAPRYSSRTRAKPEATGEQDGLCALVLQAQGAYLVRNYQAAIDHLEAPLTHEPAMVGGQRLFGQALARLNREEEAIQRLCQAASQSTSDWLARASLASLLLRTWEPGSGAPGDAGGSAIALLKEALVHAPPASQSAIRELLGAACWRTGQEALRAGHGREAVRSFAAAGAEFARAAADSLSARRELVPRQSAALVGQAVALIVAGATEAAQRLFSLTPLPPLPSADPLCRFAAGLYELCDELAQLPAAERGPAVEALRQVVLQTRLEVALYDGRGVVSLCWRGGTL